jgi:hypothetical protein
LCVRVSTQTSRAFRLKPAGDSDAKQPPFPRQASRLEGVSGAVCGQSSTEGRLLPHSGGAQCQPKDRRCVRFEKFFVSVCLRPDAVAHGVDVHPFCVNASRWDCTLEATEDDSRFAVQLGMRMVKGLANAHPAAIVTARTVDPFAWVNDQKD